MTRLPGQFEVEVDGRRRVVALPEGSRSSIADALREEDIPLNTRCAGKGRCGGCTVELLAGEAVQITAGKATGPGTIRACDHAAKDGAVIRVPTRSRLAHRPQIVTDFRLNVPAARDPLWQEGSTAGALGAAIDVGTTTVAVLLAELETGRIVARAAGMNRQAAMGDDVLTRINLCSTEPTALVRLRNAVVSRTVVPLLEEALAAAGVGADRLKCCAVVGNTTMLHLLAGVDPSPMGVAPFTPSFLDHRVVNGHDIPGWPADWDVPVHLLPGAAAYVGADLTAGAVATGLLYDDDDRDGASLLVDAGTNGEIILKHGRCMLGCATAAGPAFEGAGLSCGVRAGEGAIEHLSITQETFEFTCDVIGRVRQKPIGICGSGYVDFLAEARRAGLLTATGRFTENARRLLRPDRCGGRAVAVTSMRGSDVLVSEADVAALLSAKAAIAAGILTLLERSGLTPRQVRTVYLAGGFGTHVNVTSAIGCGLLPGFDPSQVLAVGNSALAGAYLALLDRGAIDEMETARRTLDVVELNVDPHFEARYIDHLPLPEPTAVHSSFPEGD